jgi:hypothetical protein
MLSESEKREIRRKAASGEEVWRVAQKAIEIYEREFEPYPEVIDEWRKMTRERKGRR